MKQVKFTHKKIFTLKISKQQQIMIEDLYWKRYNLNTIINR